MLKELTEISTPSGSALLCMSTDTVYCEHDAVEYVNSLILYPKHIGYG